MSSLTNEMKVHLAQLVAGTLTLDAFHDWFAATLRDVHDSNDPDAELLAHAIEWTFCDMERGLSHEAARLTFAVLADSQPTFVFRYGALPTQGVATPVMTGTSSVLVPVGRAGQRLGVGPALVYA
jgi:hypothetical protein